jgi:hypothetical protein
MTTKAMTTEKFLAAVMAELRFEYRNGEIFATSKSTHNVTRIRSPSFRARLVLKHRAWFGVACSDDDIERMIRWIERTAGAEIGRRPARARASTTRKRA